MEIFGNIFNGTLTVGNFVMAIVCAGFLGVLLAVCYMIKNNYSKSFIYALVLIPVIETAVIILVNDNLGVALSVAGSFALIRFRSVKGTARELVNIFMAMTIGVVCGSGYLGLACLLEILVCLFSLGISLSRFGEENESNKYLKITIPESLDYDQVFKDVLIKYCNSYELISLKTLNLGSLFRVEYKTKLKNINNMKKMIDEIRTLNGNLEIVCCNIPGEREDL